jgi:hypothetical protein
LPRLQPWALDPDNWFLVASAEHPFSLESRLSERFPCLVFEDGPIECAAPGHVDVQLDNLDEVLQATGIYQIWQNGNLGQAGSVCVLDTGIRQPSTAVTASAVGGLSPTDIDGHGSAIVELIRALSPEATIESICVTQTYAGGQIWNLISGLTQLYSRHGLIVNLALGVAPDWIDKLGPQAIGFRESISHLLSSLGSNHCLPVSASGNDGRPRLRWPAACAEALAVGSHNQAFARSSFSNHRSDASNLLLAPGGEFRETDGYIQGFGRYGHGLTRSMYGTSFSTAVATAVCSLLQAHPWFSQMHVSSRIALFRNHCRRNDEGIPLLNVADIGAVWPV